MDGSGANMNRSSLFALSLKAAVAVNGLVLLLGIIIAILLTTVFNTPNDDGSNWAPLGIILSVMMMTPSVALLWILSKNKKASQLLSIGAVVYGVLASAYAVGWIYMMETAK